MISDKHTKITFILAGLMVGITLARIAFLYYFPYGLFYDEAQYWLWSKNLDFGYYSKPPMVAWLIAATTYFCGDTIFCIKLASPLMHLFTAWGVFLIGRTLYNSQIGMWSAITYLTLPSLILSSCLISTDPPLLCAWTHSVYYFIQAISPIKEAKNTNTWIYVGIASGLGMMSKYTMVFFLPSALLYVYITSPLHHRATYRGIIIAFFTACIIYFPNILWNIENGFVSYLHTKDVSRLEDHSLFHFSSLFAFLAAQIGIFGPILYGSFIWIFIKKIKNASIDSHVNLLLCFTLPLLCTIILISFLSRAHANWAAPCYITATLLVVKFLFERKKLLVVSLLLHGFIHIIFFSYEPLKATFTPFQNNVRFDPFRRLKGWEALADAFKDIQKEYPEAILLTDQRKIIAYMMYYLRPHAFNAIKWKHDISLIKDHYELTTDITRTSKDQSFLLLTENYPSEAIASHFEVTYYIKEILIPTHDNYALHYHVFFLQHRKAPHP